MTPTNTKPDTFTARCAWGDVEVPIAYHNSLGNYIHDYSEGTGMHPRMTELISIDCVAYEQHEAPASILDKWSKEQLAFAISELARNMRLMRREAVKDSKSL